MESAPPDHPSHRAYRFAAAFVALVLLVASLAGATSVYGYSGVRVGANEYNIPAWELRNFPAKWLFAIGDLFRPARSQEQQDADLQRFFQLSRQIDALEQQVGDASSRGTSAPGAEAALHDKRRLRDSLESYVEATIESRLTAVIKQARVTRDFGPLGLVVWPPVDFELTRSPRSLAISPRAHIELKDARLLSEGLDIEAVEKVESDTERKENVSALAFATGGIGAYPTIIDYPTSYRSALEVIAHEWTHNYLTFRPLGLHYYDNGALRSINETTADLVGHELAGMVVTRWPLDELPDQPATQPQTPAPNNGERVNIGAELRRLRGEVDTLLAAGKIDEAEALMEQRRQELVAKGVYIRKINQAYFAFNNLYAGAAGNPGVTNPIGPKIDDLRRRAGSLAAFVHLIGSVTSVSALDRALQRIQ